MNKTYFMGDIHGKAAPISAFLERLGKSLDSTDTLVILGDVGANYYKNKKDKKFKELLNNYGFNIFCIRGNHEERPSVMAAAAPEDWTQEWFFGDWVWVEKEYPNIKYAMDLPTIYFINGHNTLVIPGAYSVDKYYRLANGWSWFEQEQLTEKEKTLGRKLVELYGWHVDLVLSHTCPISFEPTDLFLSFIDQSTVDKEMERYLGEIEYNLDYKVWLWGHFHSYRDYPRTDGKTRIMLSAGGEAVELDQIMNSSTAAPI